MATRFRDGSSSAFGASAIAGVKTSAFTTSAESTEAIAFRSVALTNVRAESYSARASALFPASALSRARSIAAIGASCPRASAFSNRSINSSKSAGGNVGSGHCAASCNW